MKKDHLEGSNWSSTSIPRALAISTLESHINGCGTVAITSNTQTPIRLCVGHAVVDLDTKTARTVAHGLLKAVHTWHVGGGQA